MQRKFVHRFAVVVAVIIVISVSFVSIRLIAQAKQAQRFVLSGQNVPLSGVSVPFP